MRFPWPPGRGAGRRAAFPGSKSTVKLPSLESVTSTKLQPARQLRSAALPVYEPGPDESIKTFISKRKTSISVYVFEPRYRRIVDIEPLDIEVETSIFISGCVDIEVQNVDIYEFSMSGYVDIWSFDIKVAYRTRYRRHKSKRRYRRVMMLISAYTDIGYKTSISTSWQDSRCGLNQVSIWFLRIWVTGLCRWHGSAWSDQVGWMAMRPGANMPLRPSVAVWRLSKPSIYWGPRVSKASSNRLFWWPSQLMIQRIHLLHHASII